MNINDIKQTMNKTLPDYLTMVTEEYCQFTNQSPPEDAKGFAAHHAAAKSALAHLDLLYKILRWSGDEASSNENNSSDEICLNQARQALQNIHLIDEDNDH